MSLFRPNHEYFVPRKGKKLRNKKDGKPLSMQREHYSKSEVRMAAIEAEGHLAYSNGVDWDSNPKISLGSRQAWWNGWNKAHNGES